MENISNSSSNTFFFIYTIHFPLNPLSSFLSLYISCVQEQNCHQTHLREQSPPSFSQLCVAATQTFYRERNCGNFVKLLPGIGWICGCLITNARRDSAALLCDWYWLIFCQIQILLLLPIIFRQEQNPKGVLFTRGNVGSIISCALKHIHTFSS